MRLFMLPILAMLLAFSPPACPGDARIEADIRLTQEADLLLIEPFVANLSADSLALSYEFQQLRIQPNGSRSEGSQASTVKVAPRDTLTLSRQRVNISPGGRCEMQLLIREKQKIIVKVTKEYEAE